ncbi:cornifelin homolog [Ahaetulla prasina]|uniref:cornifelin homolog n=1 Tax=Ahaetulla prasina TaxID=499056 RepID=UPI002648E534|nr:cornifelin homolog [Ahaetulla prasina]
MAFHPVSAVSSQPCTTQPCATHPPCPNQSSCRAPYRDWKTDLLDCCVDKQICICGTFAPCVLACQVAAGLGECFCLPILPGAMVALRTSLREQMRIEVFFSGFPWLAVLSRGDCEPERIGRDGKA